MDEDASLDQFLGVGDERESDDTERSADSDLTAADDATGERDDGGDSTPEDDPTPAATTYAWSADGASCEACGAVVERRWRQDGALVCPDCKVWDRD